MENAMRKKTLPASLENLPLFQSFIAGAAEEAKFPREKINKLALVVEEALVNIFSYAYPEGTSGDVTVSFTAGSGDTFSIRFEDKGQPFDMLSVDDPDTELSIEDREIGGLGIFFIKQMAESVEYLRKDATNILTLQFSGG